jgi:hypothetical protein
LALLLFIPALYACSDDGSNTGPAMLGYQDCRIKMREHFLEQGLHPAAADMKSKSTCEARFKSE